MDALFMEQHLRSPLGMFPEPMMSQLMPQDNASDGASAALLEKARQHLQMWGRSPYTELLLPQMYQRPNLNTALNLGLWQGQWSPQLSAAAGFLNNQAALHQAAAQRQSRTPPPTTSSSSSGSPSPDMRSKHYAPRFSPYQIQPSSHGLKMTSLSALQPPPTISLSPSTSSHN